MANFYIADTHLGHQNVLKYDTRPFADLGEMEDALVENWNQAITEADTVYILGDFIWGKKQSEWLKLTEQLRGKKVLLRGNHDLGREQMSMELLARFETVADYLEIVDEGRHVTLCHYPIVFYHGSYRPNCYMLCGHVHRTRENDYMEELRLRMRKDSQAGRGNIYNVGCMMPYMNYTPRTLNEILSAAEGSEEEWP